MVEALRGATRMEASSVKPIVCVETMSLKGGCGTGVVEDVGVEVCAHGSDLC